MGASKDMYENIRTNRAISINGLVEIENFISVEANMELDRIYGLMVT